MLQAVFHPRINYPTEERSGGDREAAPAKKPAPRTTASATEGGRASQEAAAVREEPRPRAQARTGGEGDPRRTTSEVTETAAEIDDDGAPLPEVPKLPRSSERRRETNGRQQSDEDEATGKRSENAE
jgi:hypothetical protein